MHTFGQGASLAPRQLLWLAIGTLVYLIIAATDVRLIRRTPIILALYAAAVVLLVLLFAVAHPVLGARAWFTLGPVSFQPADLAKLAIIMLLAKYLSRRHVEIADWRHILITVAYVGVPALLILLEPDLGNTIIFGTIWLGMMFVSGLSSKQLGGILLIALIGLTGLWFGGLKPYQRTRILSFVNPAANIHGAGYNAYQARIAVGSGELVGKGVGYGTQSKLRFLPEYQTDFIFAAFAEEWGFMGVLLLLALYGLLFKRLIDIASASATNFDTFFTLGVLILLAAHVVIHVGINVGLLPVTGTTIPFMSSGGSHVVLEFGALGIVTSLARQNRAPREAARANEFLGA
jgi:rod shape determining protein RodA